MPIAVKDRNEMKEATNAFLIDLAKRVINGEIKITSIEHDIGVNPMQSGRVDSKIVIEYHG